MKARPYLGNLYLMKENEEYTRDICKVLVINIEENIDINSENNEKLE